MKPIEPLLPLLPPPPQPDTPALAPLRPDVHVFPAAFPRYRKGSAVYEPCARHPRPGKNQVREIAQAIIDRHLNAPVTNVQHINEPLLRICAQRYRRAPKTSKGVPLVLVFVHANGLHKETWEPALEELLAIPSDHYHVEEAWSLDIANQGDSAVLNAPNLGPVFDWADVARDAAQFIINYLPPRDAIQRDLPVQLPAQPLHGAAERLNGLDNASSGQAFPLWRGRRIVLVGHSIGGAGALVAAAAIPNLLSGVICVDPVLTNKQSTVAPNTTGALLRRDAWPNRTEALHAFEKNQNFFGRWDKRVLQSYVDYALKDMPDGTVALKTEREQEANGFSDSSQGARRGFASLPRLASSLRLHFVLADEKQSLIDHLIGKDNLTADALLQSAKQCRPTLDRLECGHLVAQEDPAGLARSMSGAFDAWFSKPNAKL